jgi:hypothetical protein
MRSRRSRKLVVVILVGLWLTGSVPVARAQEEPDYIADLTIGSTSIDLTSRVPTLIGSVRCLVDANFVRIRAILEQAGARSSQVSGVTTCMAGEVEPFTVVFGLQQGRFRPGPATLSGFAEAFAACCETASDIDLFPVDRVILRPGRTSP